MWAKFECKEKGKVTDENNASVMLWVNFLGRVSIGRRGLRDWWVNQWGWIMNAAPAIM